MACNSLIDQTKTGNPTHSMRRSDSLSSTNSILHPPQIFTDCPPAFFLPFIKPHIKALWQRHGGRILPDLPNYIYMTNSTSSPVPSRFRAIIDREQGESCIVFTDQEADNKPLLELAGALAGYAGLAEGTQTPNRGCIDVKTWRWIDSCVPMKALYMDEELGLAIDRTVPGTTHKEARERRDEISSQKEVEAMLLIEDQDQIYEAVGSKPTSARTPQTIRPATPFSPTYDGYETDEEPYIPPDMRRSGPAILQCLSNAIDLNFDSVIPHVPDHANPIPSTARPLRVRNEGRRQDDMRAFSDQTAENLQYRRHLSPSGGIKRYQDRRRSAPPKQPDNRPIKRARASAPGRMMADHIYTYTPTYTLASSLRTGAIQTSGSDPTGPPSPIPTDYPQVCVDIPTEMLNERGLDRVIKDTIVQLNRDAAHMTLTIDTAVNLPEPRSESEEDGESATCDHADGWAIRMERHVRSCLIKKLTEITASIGGEIDMKRQKNSRQHGAADGMLDGLEGMGELFDEGPKQKSLERSAGLSREDNQRPLQERSLTHPTSRLEDERYDTPPSSPLAKKFRSSNSQLQNSQLQLREDTPIVSHTDLDTAHPPEDAEDTPPSSPRPRQRLGGPSLRPLQPSPRSPQPRRSQLDFVVHPSYQLNKAKSSRGRDRLETSRQKGYGDARIRASG